MAKEKKNLFPPELQRAHGDPDTGPVLIPDVDLQVGSPVSCLRISSCFPARSSGEHSGLLTAAAQPLTGHHVGAGEVSEKGPRGTRRAERQARVDVALLDLNHLHLLDTHDRHLSRRLGVTPISPEPLATKATESLIHGLGAAASETNNLVGGARS